MESETALNHPSHIKPVHMTRPNLPILRHGLLIPLKAGFFFLALGLPLVSQAALSINGFTAATNDRYENDPSFVGNPYDWSGVGRSADGKWAVMISPNVFLSATHFHAADGATLSFFPGNDPGATPVTGVISSSQQIGGTDLWIGALSSPLAGSIASYDFITVPLTEASFTGSVLDNEFAYMSGVSQTVGGYGASPLTNQAVGTNRIEGFEEDLVVGASTGDSLLLVDNEIGDPAFTMTSFEAKVNGGDSGSPLMIVTGGNLTIAGIAWATGTVDIDPAEETEVNRGVSAYTYVGNHTSEIVSFLGANPVPEPSTWGMILLVAPAFICRRRRSQSAAPTDLRR